MIIDSQNMFENSQALTTSRNSTNVIDLSVARDIGVGTDIFVNAVMTEAAAAAGAATLQVALVAADTADLATNPIVLMQTDAIGKANLTPGVRLLGTSVPISRAAGKRYLGLVFTIGTGPLTAGKLHAGLSLDLQANIAYPSGLNVGYV